MLVEGQTLGDGPASPGIPGGGCGVGPVLGQGGADVELLGLTAGLMALGPRGVPRAKPAFS